MLQRRTHTGEPWALALNATRFAPGVDVGKLVGRELPGAGDAVAELLRSGTRLFHRDGRVQVDLLLRKFSFNPNPHVITECCGCLPASSEQNPPALSEDATLGNRSYQTELLGANFLIRKHLLQNSGMRPISPSGSSSSEVVSVHKALW